MWIVRIVTAPKTGEIFAVIAVGSRTEKKIIIPWIAYLCRRFCGATRGFMHHKSMDTPELSLDGVTLETMMMLRCRPQGKQE